MQDVDPLHLVLAAQGVDAHLGHGGPEGEVVEGAPLAGAAVVVDQRGSVEALLGERDAPEIGRLDQLAPGDAPLAFPFACYQVAVLQAHAFAVEGMPFIKVLGGEVEESRLEGQTGVAGGHAVEVRTAGGGGGGGVGHLVGAGGGDAHRLHVQRSSRATTWQILVCSPWPISVPPWLICTLPSV